MSTTTDDATRRIMSEQGLFTSHREYHHVEPSALFADMPGELVRHERGFVYPSNPSWIVRLAPVAS